MGIIYIYTLCNCNCFWHCLTFLTSSLGPYSKVSVCVCPEVFIWHHTPPSSVHGFSCKVFSESLPNSNFKTSMQAAVPKYKVGFQPHTVHWHQLHTYLQQAVARINHSWIQFQSGPHLLFLSASGNASKYGHVPWITMDHKSLKEDAFVNFETKGAFRLKLKLVKIFLHHGSEGS